MLPIWMREVFMDYDHEMNMNNVQFGDMPPQAFLLGLLSAFDNRYQASADAYLKEITWKQFFLHQSVQGAADHKGTVGGHG